MSAMHGQCVAVTIVALAAAGCGAADQETTTVVRDSAGVRITESLEPRSASRAGDFWQVDEQPEIRIGAVEGEAPYLFTVIVGIAGFADGSIAVADGQTAEVRLFDAAGMHVLTTGGRGAGPGEFGDLRGMWKYRSDSILTWDARRQRLQVFEARGTFTRGFDLRITVDHAQRHYLADFPHVVGALGDGAVVVEMPYAVGLDAATGPEYATTTLLRFDARGGGPDSLATVPVQWLEIRETSPRMATGLSLFPVMIRPVVGQDHVFSGTAERYEILSHAADGRLEAVHRRRFNATPVEPRDVAAEKDRRLAAARNADMRRILAVSLEQRAIPDAFPAFDRLLVDELGHLWVREYTAQPDTTATWSVLDPAGVWLGDVAMPASLQPYEIGANSVLGTWADELGVQQVRRYRLSR